MWPVSFLFRSFKLLSSPYLSVSWSFSLNNPMSVYFWHETKHTITAFFFLSLTIFNNLGFSSFHLNAWINGGVFFFYLECESLGYGFRTTFSSDDYSIEVSFFVLFRFKIIFFSVSPTLSRNNSLSSILHFKFLGFFPWFFLTGFFSPGLRRILNLFSLSR